MDLVPGAVGAMIVGASPLFIAMVAHITQPDDKMTRMKTLSFLVGVAGIALISFGRQGVETRHRLEWVGILLLMVNNMASGYSNVLVSRSKRPLSPVILTSASLMSGGVVLYIISLFTEGFQSGPFPLRYYMALTWLAFLSAAAFSIWYGLLKRPGVKVSELNVWKFLIPVSGAGLSWLLVAGEKPDWTSLTGMFIIVLALVLMNRNSLILLVRGKKFRE
jgi:drug/metabolite transporter (DMT)-like permease